VQTVHVDTVSGASTVLYTFTVDRGVSWEVSFVLKPLSVFLKNLWDMKCIYTRSIPRALLQELRINFSG